MKNQRFTQFTFWLQNEFSEAIILEELIVSIETCDYVLDILFGQNPPFFMFLEMFLDCFGGRKADRRGMAEPCGGILSPVPLGAAA